jgi:uncharacterized membrane protein
MEEHKVNAMIGHFTIIGTIVALMMNTEKKNLFVSFYTRQTLGIFLSFHLGGYFIGYFDSWFVSTAYWLFFLILWIISFAGVMNNEMKLVPLVGEQFQKWFKNL